MPASIKMSLSNGHPTRTQIAVLSYNANLAAIPKSSAQLNAPLSAPMVKRIHNVKPGCGSCGRK
jgi:hypothetical protein